MGSLAERSVNGPRSATDTWSKRVSAAEGVTRELASSLYCCCCVDALTRDAGILSVDPPRALPECPPPLKPIKVSEDDELDSWWWSCTFARCSLRLRSTWWCTGDEVASGVRLLLLAPPGSESKRRRGYESRESGPGHSEPEGGRLMKEGLSCCCRCGC